MDFLPPVVASLLADIGEFQTKFKEAEATTTKFQAAQAKLAAAGKVAMGALALGAVAVGVESVKMATNFNQAMELVHTQAGASQAEVDALKGKVLALAPAVGIGPEKLAEGLYHVESAGFRGSAALDITAAAARDAAIGMGDMETTTQALIGVMASGIGGVKDAADAAAYLNQIVGIGDMRMDKLAASIATGILPSFRSAGLQMNDFGAALATITDNATPADEAATRLRMTVSLMAAPSQAAQKALASIGIGSTQLADDMRKPNGLLVAVMDLKTHLENAGMSASQQNQVIQQAFGGGKTSGAIMTLLEESDRLKDKYGELGTQASRAGKFQDAWASQQQQFKQQTHQLGAELQVIGITIGNFLIPKIQESAGWLAKHIGVVKIAAVVIGSILVAAMMAFTYAVIANTVAMLANPVTWIVLAIVAAIALLAFGIYELVKHWGAVWGFIKRISLDVWHWLVSAWNATWAAVAGVVGWIYEEIIKPIGRFFGLLVDAWKTEWSIIAAVVGWINANVVQPLIHLFEKYVVGPIKLYLAIVVWVWKFAFGFISQVVRGFVQTWRTYWGLVVAYFTWVWNNVLRPTFEFIDKYGIQPVATALGWLVGVWKQEWDLIGQAVAYAWAGLKVVWGYIDKYGIQPVASAIRWLVGEWKSAWHLIGQAASDAWIGLKIVWGYIDKYGIQPLRTVIDGFKNAWHDAWQSAQDGVGRAWTFISGILNRLKDALNHVFGMLGDLAKDPIGAGRALAKFLGFSKGGPVPGAKGEPMLAVVHGGEYVLSNDMLASMRSGSGLGSGSIPGPVGAGRPSEAIIVQANLYLDGKQLHTALVPVAQRVKTRTGSTGLD